jgi:hypothetical protein
MLGGKVYVRVVTQDRDRGFMLLVGFDKGLVQRTASQVTTLSCVTRASLTKMIDAVKTNYNASAVENITAPAITKRLQKLFGESEEKTNVES